jgi:hypothetical protein
MRSLQAVGQCRLLKTRQDSTHHAASATAASQRKEFEVLTLAKEHLPTHATEARKDEGQAKGDGASDKAYFQHRYPSCC